MSIEDLVPRISDFQGFGEIVTLKFTVDTPNFKVFHYVFEGKALTSAFVEFCRIKFKSVISMTI